MIKPRSFQRLLLAWFDVFGRKNLPWQRDKTPYRVWISEIMLQQTQVKTVVPYFERFIEQLPNVDQLAKAEEEQILHLWTGLGYYARARHLPRAAHIMVEQHQGNVPHTLDALLALPGIGRSTAGAILALAFNQAIPILDGNVKRVLSRLHAIHALLNHPSTEKTLWELATHYTPVKRVDHYTQAMMDFGATICTPKQPGCSICPLTTHCLAYQEGSVSILPYKKKTLTLPTRETTFLILQKKDCILLYKRPTTGVWAGLWSFPELPGQPLETLITSFCDNLELPLGIKYQHLAPFVHTFSHYRLRIFPVIIPVNQVVPIAMTITEANQQLWYDLSSPQSIGLPKPVKSLLETLR